MKGALLTLAASLPSVDSVVDLNDTTALGEMGNKALDVANAGASITFKVGIVIMVILLIVAIILLAMANSPQRPEMKNRLIVAAICTILLFSVLSYMTVAQSLGSGLFSTTTEQSDGDGNTNGG